MRANKPIVRVSQNMEPVVDMLDGLVKMQKQIEDLSQNEIKNFQQSLDPALKAAAERYAKIIGDVIDYEAGFHAQRGEAFDSVFRHLYQGGNPLKMGDKENRLFSVTYKKITEGRGKGYQIAVNTRVDSAPAVSSLTGSDKSIVSTGNELAFGNDYPAWRERAAFVYSKFVGGTKSGSSSGAENNQYIVYAEPQPKTYATQPPEKVVSAESFTTNYSSYSNGFHDWWERQMAVTGPELLEVLDRSAKDGIGKALAKLYRHAKTKEGAQRLESRSHVVMPRRGGGNYRTANVEKHIMERDSKVATLVGREFAKAFSNAVNRNKHKISKTKTAPAGPASEEVSMSGFLAGMDAVNEDRFEEEDVTEYGDSIYSGGWG